MKYCLAFLILLVPQAASAHLVSTRFGEFYAGMLHPAITLDHLLPWLALGLLAGTQQDRFGRWTSTLFPLAVLLGAFSGSALVGVEDWLWVGWFNLSSFIVFGVLAVLARPVAVVFYLFLIVVFGLSHGLGNSATDLAGNDLILYVLGVSLTSYLTITLLAAASHAIIQQRGWGLTAVRAIGSWITAVGVLYIGLISLSPVAA